MNFGTGAWPLYLLPAEGIAGDQWLHLLRYPLRQPEGQRQPPCHAAQVAQASDPLYQCLQLTGRRMEKPDLLISSHTTLLNMRLRIHEFTGAYS